MGNHTLKKKTTKPWICEKILRKLWYYDRMAPKAGFQKRKQMGNMRQIVRQENFSKCLCRIKQLNRHENKSTYWVLVEQCSIFKVYDSKKFIKATYLYKVSLGKLHIQTFLQL